MATQGIVYPPLRDLNTVICLPDDEVAVDVTASSSDAEDPLNPARGILFALLLCAPFWIGVYWLLQ